MSRTMTTRAARQPAAKRGAAPRQTEAELIPSEIADLSPRLRADFGEVSAIVSGLQAHALRAYRQLGRFVHQWQTERDAYEGNAIELISKRVQLGTSVLYASAQLYDRISEEEFDSWLAARTPAGNAMTWTHASCLLRVSEPAQRQDLFERAMRESLTAAELEAQVRALNDGVSQRPGSGRKFAKPSNEMHFRGNFESVARDVMRRVEQVWTPALTEFTAREPNLAAIGELDVALRQHDALTAAVHRQREELLRLRNTYAAALKQPLIGVAE